MNARRQANHPALSEVYPLISAAADVALTRVRCVSAIASRSSPPATCPPAASVDEEQELAAKIPRADDFTRRSFANSRSRECESRTRENREGATRDYREIRSKRFGKLRISGADDFARRPFANSRSRECESRARESREGATRDYRATRSWRFGKQIVRSEMANDGALF